jgi:hypothetical protein
LVIREIDDIGGSKAQNMAGSRRPSIAGDQDGFSWCRTGFSQSSFSYCLFLLVALLSFSLVVLLLPSLPRLDDVGL